MNGAKHGCQKLTDIYMKTLKILNLKYLRLNERVDTFSRDDNSVLCIRNQNNLQDHNDFCRKTQRKEQYQSKILPAGKSTRQCHSSEHPSLCDMLVQIFP